MAPILTLFGILVSSQPKHLPKIDLRTLAFVAGKKKGGEDAEASPPPSDHQAARAMAISQSAEFSRTS